MPIGLPLMCLKYILTSFPSSNSADRVSSILSVPFEERFDVEYYMDTPLLLSVSRCDDSHCTAHTASGSTGTVASLP